MCDVIIECSQKFRTLLPGKYACFLPKFHQAVCPIFSIRLVKVSINFTNVLRVAFPCKSYLVPVLVLLLCTGQGVGDRGPTGLGGIYGTCRLLILVRKNISRRRWRRRTNDNDNDGEKYWTS